MALLTFSSQPAFSEEDEQAFKEILSVVAEISKTDYRSGAERWKYLREQRSNLKKFVARWPHSVWADDAQYVISALTIPEINQHVVELEYLLKRYPDAHIETWNRDMLDFMFPKPPIDLAVRIELAMDYLQTGQIDHLRNLCQESMQKYPEKAPIFEKLLSRAQKE